MSERAPGPMDQWVGSRLRQRRASLGWSIPQLAKECGVSHQQMVKYESGVTRLAAQRIYDLSVVLQVHPGYFFDGYDGLPTNTNMAEEIREVTTKDGVQLLMAFNRLMPEQKAALRLIIDAMEKANLAERTLGDMMQKGPGTDGGC